MNEHASLCPSGKGNRSRLDPRMPTDALTPPGLARADEAGLDLAGKTQNVEKNAVLNGLVNVGSVRCCHA